MWMIYTIIFYLIILAISSKFVYSCYSLLSVGVIMSINRSRLNTNIYLYLTIKLKGVIILDVLCIWTNEDLFYFSQRKYEIKSTNWNGRKYTYLQGIQQGYQDIFV
jgi:O-antigen ligase